MVILWPHGARSPLMNQVLEQLYGRDLDVRDYTIPESESPLGIVRLIQDNPEALVYVAARAQIAVASVHTLRFAFLEIDDVGLKEICVVDPWDKRGAIRVIWSDSDRPNDCYQDYDLGTISDDATVH